MYKFIGQCLMGIGLAILGLSLVFDPWSEERYERAIRETVRLNNDFYVYLNQLIEMNEEIGWFLFFSAFLIMNRVKQGLLVVIGCITLHGLIYHNQYMYESDRFGDDQWINGIVFHISAVVCSVLICL